MSRKKKSENKSVLVVIVFAIVISGSIIYNTSTLNTNSSVIEKDGKTFVLESIDPITLTIVTDTECEKCSTTKLEALLKNQLGEPLAVRRLEHSSREGKEILKQYDGLYLPFLLIGDEVSDHKSIGHLSHHVITKVKDRYLVDLEKIGAPIGRHLGVANYEKDDPNAPQISISRTEQNLGKVTPSDGKIQTKFTIKNDGKNPLVFLGLNTSCGCTSAKMVIFGEESPIYQMAGHGEPVKWRGELDAGEEGEIVVYYDPSVHPDIEADVMREVYIKTNDPNSPDTTLKIFVYQSPN